MAGQNDFPLFPFLTIHLQRYGSELAWEKTVIQANISKGSNKFVSLTLFKILTLGNPQTSLVFRSLNRIFA